MKTKNVFKLNVQIPVNSSAVIELPAGKNDLLQESGQPIGKIKELKLLKFEDGRAFIKAGSGDYKFTVTKI